MTSQRGVRRPFMLVAGLLVLALIAGVLFSYRAWALPDQRPAGQTVPRPTPTPITSSNAPPVTQPGIGGGSLRFY